MACSYINNEQLCSVMRMTLLQTSDIVEAAVAMRIEQLLG